MNDWQLIEGSLVDLGQWIADQQAMPDDGWVDVRDLALDALYRRRKGEEEAARILGVLSRTGPIIPIQELAAIQVWLTERKLHE